MAAGARFLFIAPVLNVGARCFILSSNLSGFCLSLGGFAGHSFIQVGAFVGYPPWVDPFWLAVTVGHYVV